MKNIAILWIDDEIDLLKPLFLFLQERGYSVAICNNGTAALALDQANDYDVILLDEHMPGLRGLETLSQLKNIAPNTPVVMIT